MLNYFHIYMNSYINSAYLSYFTLRHPFTIATVVIRILVRRLVRHLIRHLVLHLSTLSYCRFVQDSVKVSGTFCKLQIPPVAQFVEQKDMSQIKFIIVIWFLHQCCSSGVYRLLHAALKKQHSWPSLWSISTLNFPTTLCFGCWARTVVFY